LKKNVFINASQLKSVCCSFVVLSYIAVSVAGCATPGQTTQAQGTAAGAVVGAGIGALLGKSAGDAAIGAGVGALVGLAAGTAVANNNSRQADNENNINSQIAAAQAQTKQANLDADQYNLEAQQAAERAASLDAQYRAGALSAVDYQTGMSRFAADNQRLGQEIAALQRSQNSLRQQAQADQANAPAFDQQADEQNAAQQRLQNSFAAMSDTLGRVPHG
jgi:hypothetical protein